MSLWNNKRSVMRFYNITASSYEMQHAEEQAAKIRIALEMSKLGEKSMFLDFGCGTGLLFEYVAEEAKMVVGLDISRKMLEKAKQRSKKFANVHLILADADFAPFKDKAFSHIFAVTLLQNMPKPEKTLAEVKRIALENAAVVITGLKKKFPLAVFQDLLVNLGLKVIEIKSGDESLKCHVAFCTINS